MSSFLCDKCGKEILEGDGGHYMTGCKHWPLDDLVKNQKPLDPEFSKAVDKYFWDLIDETLRRPD